MKLFVLYHNEAYMGGTEAAIDSVIEAPNLATAQRVAELRGSWLRVQEIGTVNCRLVKFSSGVNLSRAREGQKTVDAAYLRAGKKFFKEAKRG